MNVEHILCTHKVEDGYFAIPLKEVVTCLNQVDWHCTKRRGQYAVKDIDYVNNTLQIVLHTRAKSPEHPMYKEFMIPAEDCFAGSINDDDKLLANNTLQILDDIAVDKVNKRIP